MSAVSVVASAVDLAVWRVGADALTVVVFTARPDGYVDFVNRRWSLVTGHAPAAALGNAWRALLHPDDAEHFVASWRHSLDVGNDVAVEFRLRKADGAYCWMSGCATALRDGRGDVRRWYGTVIDIDARKAAEAALLQRETMLADSEQRFRVLAEAMPVMCWMADADGSIEWYNARWYEFTGQTSREAAGWGWQATHHPDDFLEVMRRWPHSIASGEPFEMEFRLRRHDGAFHWFLTRSVPMRDATGKIVRWCGSNVDIDAQKRAVERTKRVAETIQDVFLPKELPRLPDVRFDAVYLPAEKDALIGGDWFDAFELPDGRLAFSIGDVAGHGLEASVLVGRVKQAISTLCFESDDPAMILRKVDRILVHQDPGAIVTALVGFVDRSRTSLTYASAGHPPPLIAYSNQVPAQPLPNGNLLMGTGSPLKLTTHCVPIRPDAVVALYTDGMVEFARDIDAAQAKLRAAVALLVGDTSIATPARLVQEIIFDGKPATDDAALLLMQFSRTEAGSGTPPAALEKLWRFHSSDAYMAHASRLELVAYLRQMAENPDELFAAELIVGEILANTVRHAPGLVEIQVDWTKEKPILTVRDTGPGLRSIARGLPQDALDEHGRGIFLIRALSEEASVQPAPGYGCELRAVLPIARTTRDDVAASKLGQALS
jgi:PAS domain S-box-containing protein